MERCEVCGSEHLTATRFECVDGQLVVVEITCDDCLAIYDAEQED